MLKEKKINTLHTVFLLTCFLTIGFTMKSINFRNYDNIIYESDLSKFFTSDTMHVMQTSRVFSSEKKDFFSEERDTSGVVTTLLISCKNQVWHVFKLNGLKEAMAYLPSSKRNMVYIEGIGKTFPIALFRGAGMTTTYNVNVIQLDYPSKNTSKSQWSNYYFARENAKVSSHNFIRLIKELYQSKESGLKWATQPLVLFAHSMGNILLEESVKSKKIKGIPNSLFERVILNHPCVYSKDHQSWVDAIPFGKQTFIIHNQQDKTLRLAQLITLKKMLGRSKVKQTKSKAIYINTNPLIKREHNGFLDNPLKKRLPKSASIFYQQLLTATTNDLLKSELLIEVIENKAFALKEQQP